MSTDNQDAPSPKKFFRNFNVSPFRQNGTRNAPELGGSQKAHGRSQSHDIFHTRTRLANANWTSLIPPVPADSKGLRELQIPMPPPASQRHSIAISPVSLKNMPDMLQPLPTPQLEQSFQRLDFDFTTSEQRKMLQYTALRAPSQPHAIPPHKSQSQPIQQALQFTSTLRQITPQIPPPAIPSPAPGRRQLQSTPSQQQVPQKKRKICNTCNQPINGQFVRALNSAYHIECFKCHECGVQCSSKFFPHEITGPAGNVIQVPLCEYDYFRKLNLICHDCDNALRGPYITALGNKYHLEHFKCSSCHKVFDSDESYYEHENNIYCHYHYSKLFATKCEGCQVSIVKQFVELFKGGKNQQWHPECYMVYKFWNVSVTPDSVGLQEKLHITNKDLLTEGEIDPEILLKVEQQIESVVVNCWLVLSGFEELSASCISEMLLCACTGKRTNGLIATGKLIVCVEILFTALDLIQVMCSDHKPDPNSTIDSSSAPGEEIYSADAFDKFQSLRKEPRNILGKLMSYLAILRKSNQLSESGSLSAELLSVVTGCAHYLKLLIRIGLNNALKLNKLRGDTKGLDAFLNATKKFEEIELGDKSGKTNDAHLGVPHNATDACRFCLKSIEKSCVRFENFRWHTKCLECSLCHRKPTTDFKVETFLYGADDTILCTSCSKTNTNGIGYVSGFTTVTDLSQLVYLLKIAIFRSKSAIKKDDDANRRLDLVKKQLPMSNIKEESATSETENDFSRTLLDVTALRTKRESQKLSSSIKKDARKSVILEAPEAVIATEDFTVEDDPSRLKQDRKTSSASTLSFIALPQDSDQFDFRSLKIRDDPPQRLVSISLDRTSDLLKNEKSLTLDDIPRIVAAEQAREQRPNAFKHHNSLYQKKQQPLKSLSTVGGSQQSQQRRISGVKETPVPIKIKYYSELTKTEHFILRHIAVEALAAVKEYNREELVSLIQTKKLNTFWDKFKFGAGGDKNKHLNVFGVDLQEVNKKYGVDLDLGVGPSQLRIPIVVNDVINALRLKDMSVEGIFRLNGNIKNLRDLTEQINKSPLKSPAFSDYSAVQLAALMKKWLRELPNPLLTFNLYELWIASRKEGDIVMCKRILHLTYCMLPRSHRNLLEVLLYFFSWVASFANIDEETGSKMDIHNLATVIAPNILFAKPAAGEAAAVQSGESYFLAIEVVNQLIEIHEELAVIPPDLWQFFEMCNFQKADTLSTKEIFSKVNKASKEHPHYFEGFLKLEASTVPSHQNTIKRHQATVQESQL